MMKKQSLLIVTFIGFLLTLTVGYALFSDTITINGTATAKGNFDIQFSSTEIEEMGSSDTTAIISDDGNTLTITVPKLEYPGAYSNVGITITNKGSIPAKLIGIESNGLTTDKNIVVTYVGLEELKDVVINQNETQKINVKIMWNSESTEASENVEFMIKLKYEQVTF